MGGGGGEAVLFPPVVEVTKNPSQRSVALLLACRGDERGTVKIV